MSLMQVVERPLRCLDFWVFLVGVWVIFTPKKLKLPGSFSLLLSCLKAVAEKADCQENCNLEVKMIKAQALLLLSMGSTFSHLDIQLSDSPGSSGKKLSNLNELKNGEI